MQARRKAARDVATQTYARTGDRKASLKRKTMTGIPIRVCTSSSACASSIVPTHVRDEAGERRTFVVRASCRLRIGLFAPRVPLPPKPLLPAALAPLRPSLLPLRLPPSLSASCSSAASSAMSSRIPLKARPSPLGARERTAPTAACRCVFSNASIAPIGPSRPCSSASRRSEYRATFQWNSDSKSPSTDADADLCMGSIGALATALRLLPLPHE
eukprot:3455814-Pleurochrysis_carterae.AAC.3